MVSYRSTAKIDGHFAKRPFQSIVDRAGNLRLKLSEELCLPFYSRFRNVQVMIMFYLKDDELYHDEIPLSGA